MSQVEVAQSLGINKQRVSAIEANALRKLRIECQRRGFTLAALLSEIEAAEEYSVRYPQGE